MKGEFFKLFFDPGQQTCFTKDPTGTQIRSQRLGDEYFCINALQPEVDLNPQEPYHDITKPRRADHNVLCFRNFLIEIDSIPLLKQIKYVTDKIPVSTIVYSGGKSYHFIISLEQELASIDDYRSVAKRIHKLLPEADPSTKNPSRLSRIPNVKRANTGRVQTLVQINSRIPNKILLDKLPEAEYIKMIHSEAKENIVAIKARLFGDISNPDNAMQRMQLGGRNAYFFWLGNRLADCGLSKDEQVKFVQAAYENLKNTSGFSLNEALLAARIKV